MKSIERLDPEAQGTHWMTIAHAILNGNTADIPVRDVPIQDSDGVSNIASMRAIDDYGKPDPRLLKPVGY